MAYATLDELEDFLLPATPPADAERRLDRASRKVDQALLCAVYDVDDADIQETLRDATLEQTAAMIDNGDTGSGTTVTQFSIGSVSVTRGQGAASAPVQIGGLYEQAWLILQQAGLTGAGPATY